MIRSNILNAMPTRTKQESKKKIYPKRCHEITFRINIYFSSSHFWQINQPSETVYICIKPHKRTHIFDSNFMLAFLFVLQSS